MAAARSAMVGSIPTRCSRSLHRSAPEPEPVDGRRDSLLDRKPPVPEGSDTSVRSGEAFCHAELSRADQDELGNTPCMQIEYSSPLGARPRRSGSANVVWPFPPNFVPIRLNSAVFWLMGSS